MGFFSRSSGRNEFNRQYDHDITEYNRIPEERLETRDTTYSNFSDPVVESPPSYASPGTSNGPWNNSAPDTPRSFIPLIKERLTDPSWDAASFQRSENPRRHSRAGSIYLSHEYRRGNQFWKHFRGVLFRLIVSVAICASIFATFKFTVKRDSLDQGEKHLFNAAYLGLSMLLGLNLVSSFKAMADIFRWKFAASGRYGGHTARELDMILGMNSYQNCVKLLRFWWPKPRHFCILVIWIVVGIGAQVAVAMLGLTYEHETEDAFRTGPGEMNVTDLRHFYAAPDPPGAPPQVPSYHGQNPRSHVLGDAAELMLNVGPEDADESLLAESHIDIIEIHIPGNGSIEYKYYFRETYWPKTGKPITVRTDRYITAKATCEHSYITEGSNGSGYIVVEPPPPVDLYSFLVTDRNYSLPYGWLYTSMANAVTLYATPSLNMNKTEIEEDYRDADMLAPEDRPAPLPPTCGPRCGFVEVFRFTRDEELDNDEIDHPGDYFQCQVVLSEVSGPNVNIHHEVPDMVAARAASAIANAEVYHPASYGQVNTYGYPSRWDRWPQTGSSAVHIAESHVARFAIGSIAFMDRTNPTFIARGSRPINGVRLEVNWKYVWILMILLVATQLVLGLGVIVACNNVFCRDESFFSIARVLRSVMDTMGDKGSVATQEDMWKYFGKKKMRYAVHQNEKGESVDILIDEGLGSIMTSNMNSSTYYL